MTAERLLLFEDEDNLRSMLTAAVRHNGFEVAKPPTASQGSRRQRPPSTIWSFWT